MRGWGRLADWEGYEGLGRLRGLGELGG